LTGKTKFDHLKTEDESAMMSMRPVNTTDLDSDEEERKEVSKI
jgi:hypothetical protein